MMIKNMNILISDEEADSKYGVVKNLLLNFKADENKTVMDTIIVGNKECNREQRHDVVFKNFKVKSNRVNKIKERTIAKL